MIYNISTWYQTILTPFNDETLKNDISFHFNHNYDVMRMFNTTLVYLSLKPKRHRTMFEGNVTNIMRAFSYMHVYVRVYYLHDGVLWSLRLKFTQNPHHYRSGSLSVGRNVKCVV